MAVAGLPVATSDHAVRAAHMALDMLEAIDRFNERSGHTLAVRIGITAARGGWRHRKAEVHLRPVGRRRKHRQPDGIPRCGGAGAATATRPDSASCSGSRSAGPSISRARGPMEDLVSDGRAASAPGRPRGGGPLHLQFGTRGARGLWGGNRDETRHRRSWCALQGTAGACLVHSAPGPGDGRGAGSCPPTRVWRPMPSSAGSRRSAETSPLPHACGSCRTRCRRSARPS